MPDGWVNSPPKSAAPRICIPDLNPWFQYHTLVQFSIRLDDYRFFETDVLDELVFKKARLSVQKIEITPIFGSLLAYRVVIDPEGSQVLEEMRALTRIDGVF